jgi:hypothetical protein
MFIGMIYQHHRAGRGIFVTTSRFSAPAVTLANEHKIILWDGEALARKLADATSKAAVNRTERIRSRVAAVSSLPLGLLLLAGAWIQTDQVTPTPSSQSVQANAAARIPAFAPVGTSATLSPTRQPVPTLVAATVRVANTGGVGVYIRRTPNPDDKIRAYQDGSPMTIVGSDIVVGSTRWRHVLAADRTDGYVPAEYVQ